MRLATLCLYGDMVLFRVLSGLDFEGAGGSLYDIVCQLFALKGIRSKLAVDLSRPLLKEKSAEELHPVWCHICPYKLCNYTLIEFSAIVE